MTYDSDTGTYRATHDFARPSDVSATLSVAIEEVAEAEGLELSQSLYETVDPDGLARLFEPSRSTPRNDGKVTFSIDDLDVIVHASGDIEITPQRNT